MWVDHEQHKTNSCSHMQADVATVLRQGRLHVVPASQLVPGDVVEVAGTTVSCHPIRSVRCQQLHGRWTLPLSAPAVTIMFEALYTNGAVNDILAPSASL